MPVAAGIGAPYARRGERSDGLDDEARVNGGHQWGGASTVAGEAVFGADDGDRDEMIAKDPAEQEALARDIGEELTDFFVRFIREEMSFADLTFLTYESLENLHIIASGEYELVYDDEEDDANDGDPSSDYDAESATEEQEDLAQEPSRG
jgi:hypothetical protein